MATVSEAMVIARQQEEMGQLQPAVEIYQRVVQADPLHDGAWYRLGAIAFQTGQIPAALDCIGRAIAIQPGKAEYYWAMGNAFLKRGSTREAEACYYQVLEIDPDHLEARRSVEALLQGTSYPILLPAIRIQADLDFLLLFLPPFDFPLMYNGLAYLHQAVLKSGVRVQTVDANVLMYHRFQQKRVLGRSRIVLPSGHELPEHLWGYSNHLEWEREDLLEYFDPQTQELIDQIVRQRPKAVGLSVHASNRAMVNRFIGKLRTAAPEVLVVVGGYDCAHREVGPTLVPDFDYMVIFEGDLTVQTLAKAIAAGQRPRDLAGVVSRYDTQGRRWEAGPLLEDLDSVEPPRYPWTRLELYLFRQLQVPITTSRGCRWGRCRFCAECFPFRCRSAVRVADEIEEWVNRGATQFEFFESDVNGNPALLFDLCSEILRRGLRVSLMGQLRVDRRSTAEYFQHLKRAGFWYLRFGVDGWSDHVLGLQRKGYGMETVFQNLRDCHSAGIGTMVNMLVGVPGETEDDVDEMIRNVSRCKQHFHRMEFINPLYLRCGSEYFQNPDEYKIRFRKDREAIRAEHPDYVPDDLWYSEEPYIDQHVRIGRLLRICGALQAQGVQMGIPATHLLERLLQPGAYVDGSGEVRQKTALTGRCAE